MGGLEGEPAVNLVPRSPPPPLLPPPTTVPSQLYRTTPEHTLATPVQIPEINPPYPALLSNFANYDTPPFRPSSSSNPVQRNPLMRPQRVSPHHSTTPSSDFACNPYNPYCTNGSSDQVPHEV